LNLKNNYQHSILISGSNFRYLLIAFLFPLINLSNSQIHKSLDNLTWIVDKWVSTDGETISYEEWKIINDTLWEGSSKTFKDGKIIFEEKLKLISENGSIFYVADVAHNPAPVYFKLTSADSNTAVFENPEHDFPQKITYKLEEGNLHAFIEGPGKKGEWKKVDFYFSKSR